MNSSLWLSRRLRLSSSSDGRNNSAGATIAVVGVALATLVMILTLGVVSGFKQEISEKIMGFDAQITIGAPYDYENGRQEELITHSPELAAIIGEDGRELSLAIQLPALLKTNDDFAGAMFMAHDSLHNFEFERKNIIEGEFPDFTNSDNNDRIVISTIIAKQLGLSAEEKVFVYFFVDGTLKARRVTVAGIYESNLIEYDKLIVYSSMNLLQSVMGVDNNTGTRIELTGYSRDEIEPVGIKLQQLLTDALQTGELTDFYPVTTVLQTGAIYFNWLSLLDTNVVVIFVLMLCVALFTLVSSLYLIVLDRIPTIGLFRSLGASRKWLINLFVALGMRLVIRGMIWGNLIGLSLCFIQEYTGFMALDPEMYYLDKVPVRIDILGIIFMNIGVLFVAWLVLFIPSASASKIAPTETMRYE